MIWENYTKGWINAFNFSGIATRAEWWTFTLINNLIALILSQVTGSESDGLVAVIQLIMLIPAISVSVRRIRDIDISGWWSLLIIPLGLPMLIVAFIPSSIRAPARESQNTQQKSSPELKDFHYTPEFKTQSDAGSEHKPSSSRPAATRLPLKDFN